MRHFLPTVIAAIAVSASLPNAFGNQWDNFNEPGVEMDNVLTPNNLMYDGWGSWYNDGAGLMFHGTNTLAGQDHPTNPPGHGYIAPGQSILYQYDQSFLNNAPSAALGIINGAFSLWDSQVNGTAGIRNPEATLGFDWARAPLGEPFQIEIDWEHQAGTAAAWVAGYPNQASFSIPTLRLTFVDQYWSTGLGSWVDTNFDLDMTTIPPDPGPSGQWPHPYDLFTTALHELGHLAGLDDLYNLVGTYDGNPLLGFPDSTMGTLCQFGKNSDGSCIHDAANMANSLYPYRRSVDSGSLQGVLDLYTVPEPGSVWLTLFALFLMMASWRAWDRRRVMTSAISWQ